MNYNKQSIFFASLLILKFFSNISAIHAASAQISPTDNFSTVHVSSQISSFIYVLAKSSVKQRKCNGGTQLTNVEWKSHKWPIQSGRKHENGKLICTASHENKTFSFPRVPSEVLQSLTFEVYVDDCYRGNFQKVCTLPVNEGLILNTKTFNILITENPNNSENKFKCNLSI